MRSGMKQYFLMSSSILVSSTFLILLGISSYRLIPFTEFVSYNVNDGNCNSVNEGFGVHCFGDFRVPLENIRSQDFWATNAYPPLGLVPFIISEFFSRIFSYKIAMATYLLLLAGALLSPGIYLASKFRNDSGNFSALIFLGFAAHPVISALDRGSSVGFVVPILLIFVVSLRTDSAASVISAAVAMSLRPHYVVLALVFLGLGQYRKVFNSFALSCLIYISMFLLLPNEQSFSRWRDALGEHTRDYIMFVDGGGIRVSAARGLVHLSDFLGFFSPGIGNSLVAYLKWSYEGLFSPGNLLLGATVFVFLRRPGFMHFHVKLVIPLALSALFVNETYMYYNVFILLVGVMIFLGMLDDVSSKRNNVSPSTEPRLCRFTEKWWEWCVVTSVVLTLFPIWFPNGNSQPLTIEYSGLIWSAVVLSGLIKIWMQDNCDDFYLNQKKI